jgi:hypothetical protein
MQVVITCREEFQAEEDERSGKLRRLLHADGDDVRGGAKGAGDLEDE